MENHSPSLGDQFARMHDAVHAQERCAWIPSAIQALIIACLARIFGRLEQIFLAWQSGTLPVREPAIHTAHSPQIRSAAPRQRTPYVRVRRQRQTGAQSARASESKSPAWPPTRPTLAPSTNPRHARHHQARDPPRRKTGLFPSPQTHA